MARSEGGSKRAGSESSRTRRVQFRYQAPEAREVAVAGSFNEWQPGEFRLKRDDDGGWKRAVTLPPGRYEYRFVVDGEWREDPASEEQVANPYGGRNSVLEVR